MKAPPLAVDAASTTQTAASNTPTATKFGKKSHAAVRNPTRSHDIPRTPQRASRVHPALDPRLIPQSPWSNCAISSKYRARFGVCTCNSHCSWDLCRTIVAPNSCIAGTGSTSVGQDCNYSRCIRRCCHRAHCKPRDSCPGSRYCTCHNEVG